MITGDLSMARAVLDNHALLPLLSRFGIRPGGFGELSVEQVCGKNGIKTDFFLEIANAYLDEIYTPSEDFSNFSLGDMISYLRKTHDYYLNVAIPHIEKKIHDLLANSGLSDKEKGLVTGFFNDYKKEVLDHISIEEEVVMPYILELEKQSVLTRPDPVFVEKLNHYSIREFAKQHDRLEFNLENLSKLIIKYLPPFEDHELCVGLLGDMDYLVRDLVDHAEMEDRVLVPRVSELEQKVLQKAGGA